MSECYAAKQMYAKSLLDEGTTTLKLGTSWTESPYTETIAQLRETDSLHLAGTMVRRAMKAGKANDWSELLKSKELNLWTRVKIQECYHEVRKSIVQQALQKSTDFFRLIIAPVEGQGGVSTDVRVPSSPTSPD